jgi:hypothetical protein
VADRATVDRIHAAERSGKVPQKGSRIATHHANRRLLDQDGAPGLARVEPDHPDDGRAVLQGGPQQRIAAGKACEFAREQGVKPPDHVGEAVG